MGKLRAGRISFQWHDTASAMSHVAEVPPIDDASCSGPSTGLKKSLVDVFMQCVYFYVYMLSYTLMNNSAFADFMFIA